MSFNPDLNKRVQKVIFSKELKKVCHRPLGFKHNNVSQASSQKHLGLTLNNMSTFDKHLTNVPNKISKTIGLLRKLQNILPRPAFLTIYKCFIRPHLLCDIYDPSSQLIFSSKIRIDSIQFCFSLNRSN